MKINKPYALNEIGQRQNQEDNIFPAKNQSDADTRCFLVCDGMGGHKDGEVASQTVCEAFGEFLKTVRPEDFNKAVFEQALSFACDALDKKEVQPLAKPQRQNGNEAFLAHIGDSRIYQLRTENSEAKIIHKTNYSSHVNELLLAGIITEEETKTHSRRNEISRVMQPHSESGRKNADIYATADVKAGDYFFLCSYGILESLSDEDLIKIISGKSSDEDKIRTIANLCGAHSHDNFSAYLVPVIEGIAAPAPSNKSQAVQLAEALLATNTSSKQSAATNPPLKNKATKKVEKTVRKKKKSKFVLVLAIILLLIIFVTGYFLISSKRKNHKNSAPITTEFPNARQPVMPPQPAHNNSPAPDTSSLKRNTDNRENKARE